MAGDLPELHRSESYVEAQTTSTDANGNASEDIKNAPTTAVGKTNTTTTTDNVDVESGHNEPPALETDRRFGPHRHGVVGNAFLWWNLPLIRHGWGHTLTQDDLPALAKR